MDIKEYYAIINKGVESAYSAARQCKAKGYDPVADVEIPLAVDLGERVEKLIEVDGLGKRFNELLKQGLSDDVASTKICDDIMAGRLGNFDSLDLKVEKAVRAAVGIITQGITAAPLEGVTEVKIISGSGGSNYLSLSFAGPIRSAGGTAAALCVVIGDYVRKLAGLGEYKPNESEIKRYVEEVFRYNEKSHLQYLPTEEEIKTIVTRCPVKIDGDATEEYEVNVNRDLEGLSNRVRGGVCLVIAEAIAQKASKVLKYTKKWGMDWSWLEVLVKGVKKSETGKNEITPVSKYLMDIVGGRPILAHPMTVGGFRLRYGRARNSGFASKAIHPATMAVLDGFIAIGTQMKVERPGKAATVACCDSIEGPVVLLKSGDVVQLSTVEEAEKQKKQIVSILFLGDILISFGDFLETKHPLVPSPWVEEWWLEEVKAKIKDNFAGDSNKAAAAIPLDPERLLQILKDPYKVSIDEAISFSDKLGVDMHPAHVPYICNIATEEFKVMADYIMKAEVVQDNGVVRKLVLGHNPELKELLEDCFILHTVAEGKITIEKCAHVLYHTCNVKDDSLFTKYDSVVALANEVLPWKIRSRATNYVGASMGRPEAAKARMMKPAVHVLFPISDSGGPTRNIMKSVDKGKITVEIATFICRKCGSTSPYKMCVWCGGETDRKTFCKKCNRRWDDVAVCPSCKEKVQYYEKKIMDIKTLFDLSKSNCATQPMPLIKCVKRMMNDAGYPERLEKGLLRAKHGVYVYKDGTVRFSGTDLGTTHFTPAESGVSIEKLKTFGYLVDIHGEPLTKESQVVELQIQDVLIPYSGAEYLLKVMACTDDMMQNFYKVEPFYKAKKIEDVLGHLIIGLAPHTSAGIVGRIIGFTKANGWFAHPYFHAAKRRNLDGDEDSFMLLTEALIDFSKKFLSSKRGGKMDEPLTITAELDPAVVDSEVYAMDICWNYPLSFYEKTQLIPDPKEAEVDVEIISKRLGKPNAFYGFGYTHSTTQYDAGNTRTVYSTLDTMLEKVELSLKLAAKIRAVDEKDLVFRVVSRHFMPDIIGNLRSFGKQIFRCSKCNTKYRRVPLAGHCLKCGGNIILTISKGGIEKYFEITKGLVHRYGLSDYMKQRVDLLGREMASVFQEKGPKQVSLSDFM